MDKKQVQGLTGWCRHYGDHHLCHGGYETPSVVLECRCDCHAVRVMKPKGPGAPAATRKMVAKQ